MTASGVCTCSTSAAADDATVGLLLLVAGALRRSTAVDRRTGVLTYDAWRAQVGPALLRPRRGGEHCGLLMIDVDDFKRVNDTYGHLAGDAVLVAVTDVVRGVVRGGDRVGRFGGDELVVFLDALADPRAAVAVAERIRHGVDVLTVDVADGAAAITGLSVSIGVALAHDRPGGDGLTALLWSADRALYGAKHAGRNTIRVDRESALLGHIVHRNVSQH